MLVDELGSDLENQRPFLDGVQYRSKARLGVGLLNWRAHVQALQIKALLRYNDATRGEWKQVLDAWLGRTPERRGAIFANYRMKDLFSSNSGYASHLPSFFKEAVISLRSSLTLTPTRPGEVASKEEAHGASP